MYLKLFLILIKYKLYIYDVIGSTISSTNEPWTNNFFDSISNLILKTLVLSTMGGIMEATDSMIQGNLFELLN